MPGQRPGECGRRIAGRDACPTQKGRHPPQRGVSALPSPGAPATLFCVHRVCSHCGQMWSKFILLLPFALKSAPLGCPGPTIYRNLMRQNRALLGPGNAIGRLGALPNLPAISSALLLPFQRQNCFSRQRRTKAPTLRFNFSEVYRCHPARRRDTQALIGATRGLRGFEL